MSGVLAIPGAGLLTGLPGRQREQQARGMWLERKEGPARPVLSPEDVGGVEGSMSSVKLALTFRVSPVRAPAGVSRPDSQEGACRRY